MKSEGSHEIKAAEQERKEKARKAKILDGMAARLGDITYEIGLFTQKPHTEVESDRFWEGVEAEVRGIHDVLRVYGDWDKEVGVEGRDGYVAKGKKTRDLEGRVTELLAVARNEMFDDEVTPDQPPGQTQSLPKVRRKKQLLFPVKSDDSRDS